MPHKTCMEYFAATMTGTAVAPDPAESAALTGQEPKQMFRVTPVTEKLALLQLLLLPQAF